MSLATIAQAVSACTMCGLCKTRTRYVMGEGPENAAIMLVGEGPGEEEDKTGRPFVGDAGQQLNQLLARAGLKRDSLYITNVVKDRPPGNRDPTSEEVRACSGYLLEEIASVRPKVIIALGGSALSALSGKTKVGENRGKLLSAKAGVRLNGASLIGTYHPAAYLHNHQQATLDAVVEDFELAARLAGIKAEEAPPLSDTTRTLLCGDDLSVENVSEALAALEPAKVVACDLEWTGVDDQRIRWPWTPGAEAYSISFSAKVSGGLLGVGIELPLPKGAHGIIQRFLSTHAIVFHNSPADLIWLKYLGFVAIRLAGDSMLFGSLIDEGQPLSLEVLATAKTGILPGWKAPLWPHRPQNKTEWERLLNHNIGDTDATLLLLEALYEELQRMPADERLNIMRFYRELLLPAVPMFVEVAWNGVPVSPIGLEKVITDSRSVLQSLAKELGALANMDPASAEACAMSPAKTPKLLGAYFNIHVRGAAESDLEPHTSQRPVQLIQGIKHERKFLGTYLEPWYELALRDGRLRSIYRLTGVRTGRTSAELSGLTGTKKGGSVQVAPREDRVRAVIEAREGWKIVSADMAGAELRGVAWIANERTMIKLFRDGADLHMRTAMEIDKRTTVETARAVLDVEELEFARAVSCLLDIGADQVLKRFPAWKEFRQKGKGTNFALCYGSGIDTFMSQVRREYGVTLTREEAEVAHRAYFTLYADIKAWHRRATDEWQQRGYVVSPLGRYRRRLTEATQAINTPVQSLISDIVILAMVEILREFEQRKMRSLLAGFAHDNVIVESPDEEAETAKAIVEYHMTNPPLHRLGVTTVPVPLLAEGKISQTWAS